MKRNINVQTKLEIREAVTSTLFKGEYNYFNGDIRNGNRYARVSYYRLGNKLRIQVTYWEDGISHAIATASSCSTASGLTSKVARFFNFK